MLTLRITTTITVPEGVDSASVVDRFQDLVESAVRANGLVEDDTDILFDTPSDNDGGADAVHPWIERQRVLDTILSHVKMPSGENPAAAGHWIPTQSGEASLVVSVGPKPTDIATLTVRFSGKTAEPSEVVCRDHRGKSVAEWDGKKG